MKESMNKCPLCGGNGFGTRQFGLVGCERCGLILDRGVWQPGANEQLTSEFFGETFEPVRSSWVKIFERLNNRRTMARLRSMGASRGRLLEIGVGSGSFLAYAKSNGYDALGCDLSPAICKRVARATDVKMHCGTVDSLPADETFDVVVMNHVLEHVADPLALLQSISRRLAPNGLLHLAVPNVAAWEAKLPGWNSYERYHLIYFTPRTLRLATEKAGLSVKRLSTHESFSGWFLALLRTMLGQGIPRTSNQLAHKDNNPLATRRARAKPVVEHLYRLTMVVAGMVIYPLRLVQTTFGRGDEVIVLAGTSNT